MGPLVSIIIPTYNRALLLNETLDSIIEQTYSNWECIIIDDHSTDSTSKLVDYYIKRDIRFRYEKRPLNRPKGANACRNYGYEISSGECINWFDSDDIMHPYKLELQVRELQRSGKELCVCQTQFFENGIENTLGLRHPKIVSENHWEDYIRFKILFLTQAPMWRRRFLEKMVYLFDEELQAAQEWEFHVRALHKLNTYCVIDKPLVYLRKHIDSLSEGNPQEVLWNYFLARIKVYDRFKEEFNEEMKEYFLRYFLNNYKVALRNHQMELAFKIWKHFIVKSKNIIFSSKLRLTFAYPSFLLTKKGNIFLSYLNE